MRVPVPLIEKHLDDQRGHHVDGPLRQGHAVGGQEGANGGDVGRGGLRAVEHGFEHGAGRADVQVDEGQSELLGDEDAKGEGVWRDGVGGCFGVRTGARVEGGGRRT